ncbi:alpha-acetolactate decarboxylase [Mesonia sp. K7]|nr:alpha-acetolactate decarboxylase [Mesonia sp. K7]
MFKSNVLLLLLVVSSCKNSENTKESVQTYADVQIVGAMKDAMWKGELDSKIDLDTLSDRKGLYGLGPQTQLTGELLIIDGTNYVSKVTSDSTMTVQETYETSAPFFVYANVEEWKAVEVPITINDLKALENFIDEQSKSMKRPFAFKVSGSVSEATIHIQNLPPGSKVTSPQEAHVGQINYMLKDEPVDIVGFFSTEHQSVFTHHDTFMHLHLITKDRSKMGHLDSSVLQKATLYLPVE